MSDAGNQFLHLLEAENSTATALLACLREEHRVLQQLSPEELETVVVQKIELLKSMTQHAIDRAGLLSQAGFSTETDDIARFIDQQAAAAAPLWRDLLNNAAQLEEQNRINGSMIQLSQQRTQMALDLIARPDGETKTYGKQGHTAPDNTSYTSVKA